VSAARCSWKGVRIASSEASEKTYETASARNGTARPTPKSAPPSEGPTSVTVAKRACSAAAASGSCAVSTTERSAPTSAMLKKTNAEPSTKATTAICAKLSESKASATTRLPTAAIRIPSAVSMRLLRFQRSAATPAKRPKSA
jgi:hypothetical protein